MGKKICNLDYNRRRNLYQPTWLHVKRVMSWICMPTWLLQVLWTRFLLAISWWNLRTKRNTTLFLFSFMLASPFKLLRVQQSCGQSEQRWNLFEQIDVKDYCAHNKLFLSKLKASIHKVSITLILHKVGNWFSFHYVTVHCTKSRVT